MTDKKLSLSDETISLLENLVAESKDSDENQSSVVTKALVHFSKCNKEKTESDLSRKWVFTKKEEHCVRCKSTIEEKPKRLNADELTKLKEADPENCLTTIQDTPIPEGSWALLGKGSGFLCLECSVENRGDKTEFGIFLKIRKLERLKHALIAEINELAKETEAYEGIERVRKLTALMEENNKLVQEYLMKEPGSPQATKILEKLAEQNEKSEGLIADVEDILRIFIERKKRKRKLEEPTQIPQ